MNAEQDQYEYSVADLRRQAHDLLDEYFQTAGQLTESPASLDKAERLESEFEHYRLKLKGMLEHLNICGRHVRSGLLRRIGILEQLQFAEYRDALDTSTLAHVKTDLAAVCAELNNPSVDVRSRMRREEMLARVKMDVDVRFPFVRLPELGVPYSLISIANMIEDDPWDSA